MAELVTLQMAKDQMRIRHSSEDADIRRKVAQAQAAVLDFIDQRLSGAEEWRATIASWTEDSDSREFLIVQAAILKQFSGLYRDRGDDDAKAVQVWEDGLAPNVATMLRRLKDPAIA